MMHLWFYNPDSNFQMWDMTHIITIALALTITVALFAFRKTLYPYRRTIRITVGSALIISRLSLDFWYVSTGQWTLKSSLPLELCSIASILCGIMLLTKNRHLFEVFYFIAIGGALQAILTPDLNFGFPQFRYIQFFFDHFLLISAPLIMIWLYDFKINHKSLIKSFLALNGIAVVVFCINTIFSANYMFLNHKPDSASLLDFLGPYPYYIFSLELVAFIIFIILYLPFTISSSSTYAHNNKDKQ